MRLKLKKFENFGNWLKTDNRTVWVNNKTRSALNRFLFKSRTSIRIIRFESACDVLSCICIDIKVFQIFNAFNTLSFINDHISMLKVPWTIFKTRLNVPPYWNLF